MKQLSLILSSVAVVIAGIALYLQVNGKNAVKTAAPASAVNSNADDSPANAAGFKIAYFELDSLQNNYQYFKDALSTLKTKEESMNNELAALEKSYQKKIGEWQQKGNNMSQAEAEAANREYQQMQQNFQARKQQLDQSINDQMNDTRKKIRERLEAYLKEYNKDKHYSYIFSDFPEGIFYKDTVYNITNDLISGLNASYKKKN
ncbi:MAG TPA: OmpH family outer membrane protein [Chitinophagaceae bacterium]|nr:OmpH family outer membrane protein [Chitinophagaceae bacterium]